MKLSNSFDFNNNQALRFRAENISQSSTTGNLQGRIISDGITLKYYDGSLWRNINYDIGESTLTTEGIIRLGGDLSGAGSTALTPILKSVNDSITKMNNLSEIGDALKIDGILSLGSTPIQVSDAAGHILTSALTGTLSAAQEPAHTGDVTNTAGSLALSLVATSNSTLTSLPSLTSINPTNPVRIGSNISVGVGVSNTTGVYYGGTLTAGSNTYGFLSNHTIPVTASSQASYGYANIPILSLPTSGTITNVAYSGFSISPVTNIGGATSGTNTIANIYGINVFSQGTVANASVTNAYGVFINSPTGGTALNYALFTSGTAPSSFGGALSVTGATTLSSTLTATGNIGLGSSLVSNIMVNIGGTVPLVTSSTSQSIRLNTIVNPDSGQSSFGLNSSIVVNTQSSTTYPNAIGIYSQLMSKTGAGTITATSGITSVLQTIGGTNNYGIFIDGGVGNGTGSVSQVIRLGSSQTGDLLQIQANNGAIFDNVNQYGNLGIGAQNSVSNIQAWYSGNITGRTAASNVLSLYINQTMLANPSSGVYPLYISPIVDIASGTTTVYQGITIATATKTGAGTFASSTGLVVNASSFATANYAATFTGNVGINTATPAAALEVTNGYIRALNGTNVPPASGSGLELVMTGSAGFLVSYNRSGSAYLPLTLNGSAIAIAASTTLNLSASTTMSLSATSTMTITGSTITLTPSTSLTIGGTTTNITSNTYTIISSPITIVGSSSLAGLAVNSKLQIYGGAPTNAAGTWTQLASFGLVTANTQSLTINQYQAISTYNYTGFAVILSYDADNTRAISGSYIALGPSGCGVGTPTPTVPWHVVGDTYTSGNFRTSGKVAVNNDATNYYMGGIGSGIEIHTFAILQVTDGSSKLQANPHFVGSSTTTTSEICNDSVSLQGLILLGNTFSTGQRRTVVYDNLAVSGALSKGSGTFLIDHPLFPTEKDLYHAFIEGPRYDLIYRGIVKLNKGKAIVHIDTDCVAEDAKGMTPGTFAVLTQNAEVTSTQNKDGFSRTRASEIVDGVFTIYCEDEESNDRVVWQVTAERADRFIKHEKHEFSDSKGHLILEPDKPEIPEENIRSFTATKHIEEEGDEEGEREEHVDLPAPAAKGYHRHPHAFGVEPLRRKHVIRTIVRKEE